MSRVGKKPITIPESVTLTITSDKVQAKGPKGELTLDISELVSLEQKEGEVFVTRKSDTKQARSMHGTTQRLVSNIIVGVSEGYKKTLELVGVGYRVAKQGTKLVLSLGFSHPIEFIAPEGVTVEIEGNNKIFVSGIDKQAVGQVAATLRNFRPPEPYKGKGVRYEGEVVRRKAGKAAKAA